MVMIFNPNWKECSDIPPPTHTHTKKGNNSLEDKNPDWRQRAKMCFCQESNSVSRHICKYFTNKIFQFFPPNTANDHFVPTAEFAFQTDLDLRCDRSVLATFNSNWLHYNATDPVSREEEGGGGWAKGKQIVSSPPLPVVHYMCLTKACESDAQV